MDNVVSKTFSGIAIGIWILGVIGSIIIADQPIPTANYLNSIATYETTDSYDSYYSDDTDDSYYSDDIDDTDETDKISKTVFNWTIFICGIFASFISGMMFWGFSEIIKLLQRIVDK